MEKPKIIVIGSLNMDLVTRTKYIPKLGETILGESFSFFPGGKGANQAVACARLGGDVAMIGCVGMDSFGDELINNLKKEGISTIYVDRIPNESTGVATITLKNGENSIIVIPGANTHLTPKRIQLAESFIKKADILLLQMEIPLESIKEAIKLGKKHGVKVILNPAPAIELSEEMIRDVTFLTPNEHELKIVLGNKDTNPDMYPILNTYPGKVIMTKGSEGAFFIEDNSLIQVPGLKVNVTDTTGAGDTFNGALAVMLAKHTPLKKAVEFAVSAASLSVTKPGAQGGMPTVQEVNHCIQR